MLILRAQNFSDVPDDDNWLSAGEREVLAGLRFPKRRNDWRLGRWTAKQTISAFLRGDHLHDMELRTPLRRVPESNTSLLADRLTERPRSGKSQISYNFYNARSAESLSPESDLSQFEIRAAADGAPEVFIRNDPAGVAISISHAGNRGFCAAGPPGAALGCDIEQLEPRAELLAADFFTPEEIELVRNAAPENIVLITNLIWSAKESVLKALREGLRRDTRDISVKPEFSKPENGRRLWTGRCRWTSRVFHGRWFADSLFVYTLTPPNT